MPLAQAQAPQIAPGLAGSYFKGDQVTIISSSSRPLDLRGCPTQAISDFVEFERSMHGLVHVIEQNASPGDRNRTALPTFDADTGEAVFPTVPPPMTASPMMAGFARLQPILKERAGAMSLNDALARCTGPVDGHRGVIIALAPVNALSMEIHDLDINQDYWIGQSSVQCGVRDQVGTIGRVRIRIPAIYRFNTSITYAKGKGGAGDQTSNAATEASPPTIDMPIEDVSFSVRQADFRMASSQQEKADFYRAGSSVRTPPPVGNRWLRITVFNKGSPIDPQKRFDEDAHSPWNHGPFEKLPDMWGLVHYRAVTPPVRDSMKAQDEYWFDPHDAAGTLILCENTMRAVPPYDVYANCTLSFNLPSFHAQARVQPVGMNDKADLANWKEVEANTTHMLDAFVVP